MFNFNRYIPFIKYSFFFFILIFCIILQSWTFSLSSYHFLHIDLTTIILVFIFLIEPLFLSILQIIFACILLHSYSIAPNFMFFILYYCIIYTVYFFNNLIKIKNVLTYFLMLFIAFTTKFIFNIILYIYYTKSTLYESNELKNYIYKISLSYLPTLFIGFIIIYILNYCHNLFIEDKIYKFGAK